MSFRDRPKLAVAARHICRVAAFGVQTLHLRALVAAVQVWSVDGHTVAHC